MLPHDSCFADFVTLFSIYKDLNNLNEVCFFVLLFLWIVWKKSETHQHVSPKVPFAITACWEKYKPSLIAYRSFTEKWSFLEFSKTKKVLTFWSLTDSWHTTEPDCIINLKVMKMQMGLLREHGRQYIGQKCRYFIESGP